MSLGFVIGEVTAPDVREAVERGPRGYSWTERLYDVRTLEPSETPTVFDTSDPLVIQSLTFATDTATGRLYVELYDEDGSDRQVELSLPRIGSGGQRRVRPDNIEAVVAVEGRLGGWRLDAHGSSQFIIAHPEPIVCPTGVRLRVRNDVGAADIDTVLSATITYFATDD